MISKKEIQYGFQFRDETRGIIVNWYPKKGTVFAQKNDAQLVFPEKTTSEAELLSILKGNKKVTPLKKPTSGICTDAGTHGNPGPSEYNVSDLNGNVLAHAHLGVHSNNFAELAGILAGISYAKTHRISDVWTDSQVCLFWIKNKRVGKDVHERDAVLNLIEAIHSELKGASVNLKKWDTKKWGEIPADFGRK